MFLIKKNFLTRERVCKTHNENGAEARDFVRGGDHFSVIFSVWRRAKLTANRLCSQ